MAGFSVVKRGFDPTRDGSGLPSAVPTVTGIADVLGRTGVLSSTSDSAPTIVGQVSVMDAPWKAKGDTRVATDGVILGGSLNQVSSATLALTSADAGKTVVVLAVGPNVTPGGVGGSVPGVFVSTISSVAAGIATLAGSATIPGTSLTVKVGTLDTTAINAAITAASARATAQGGSGVVKLTFPSGRHFLFANVTAKSNVWLDFAGATLHCAAGNSTGLSNSMMFVPATNASITNWHMRDGTWVGTGTEAGNSGSQSVMYWNTGGFGQNGTATYTDISVKGALVTNWATGVFDIRGGSRLRLSDNTFRSCSTFTGTNTINVIMGAGGGTVPSSDVFVQNNSFDGNGAEAIAIGEANSPTSNFDRAVVTGNICRNTGAATCIDVEWSTTTTGKVKSIVIANNVVQNTATGTSASGIVAAAGASGNTDPFTMSRVLIANNSIDAADGGIQLDASDAIVTGNYVTAGCVTQPAVGISASQSIVSTADTNATTTVLNAPTNAAILNGAQLTGTNIQAGTYLVSGAGTSTWVISQAATGTTVGGAITAFVMLKNVQVSGNTIHTPAAAAKNAILARNLISSRITHNLITTDPGTTGSFGVFFTSIFAQRLGWCDITDNRVDYALADGIELTDFNDCQVARNRIYNPSELGVGVAAGLRLLNATGGTSRVRDNIIVDDRPTHKMVNAVLGSVLNSLVEVSDNHMIGWTSSPISGVGGQGRGNVYTSPSAISGRATLVAGTVTVTSAEIRTADNVLLTVVARSGTRGEVQLGTITQGTSFVIDSIQPGTASTLQTGDASIVYWRIDH